MLLEEFGYCKERGGDVFGMGVEGRCGIEEIFRITMGILEERVIVNTRRLFIVNHVGKDILSYQLDGCLHPSFSQLFSPPKSLTFPKPQPKFPTSITTLQTHPLKSFPFALHPFQFKYYNSET